MRGGGDVKSHMRLGRGDESGTGWITGWLKSKQGQGNMYFNVQFYPQNMAPNLHHKKIYFNEQKTILANAPVPVKLKWTVTF